MSAYSVKDCAHPRAATLLEAIYAYVAMVISLTWTESRAMVG